MSVIFVSVLLWRPPSCLCWSDCSRPTGQCVYWGNFCTHKLENATQPITFVCVAAMCTYICVDSFSDHRTIYRVFPSNVYIFALTFNNNTENIKEQAAAEAGILGIVVKTPLWSQHNSWNSPNRRSTLVLSAVGSCLAQEHLSGLLLMDWSCELCLQPLWRTWI